MTNGLQWVPATQICFRHFWIEPGRLFTALLICAMLLTHSKSEANDIDFSINQNAGLLNISTITASDFITVTGEVAGNAADGNLATKWAAPGMSQSITADLGIPQLVSKARISFSSYQWGKTFDYTIATSLDGINWTDVIINIQSMPLQWTEATFNPINARYVRTTINSANLPGSLTPSNSEINEIEIYGNHIPSIQIYIPAITASDYLITTGEVAENAIDGDLNTKWSGSGTPQWVTLDLGIPQLVNMAKISFAAYQWGKTYTYTLAISLDGINWTDVISNAQSAPLQWTDATFNPINARYLRLTINSATLPNYFGVNNSDINEIEIYGASFTSPNDILTLSWLSNPGGVLGYIIYYGPTPDTADVEITNLPATAVGFEPLTPSQQYDPYTELGLLPGDNVCFRLRAYNNGGTSGWSDAICGGV